MNEPDAIFDELQQHVSELHAGIDRANLPPADLWISVRSQIRPTQREEEIPKMNSFAPQPNVFIPPNQMSPPARKGFRHHLSVVASLAIVLTVALAGWFATMQINQPGGSNGQFALFGQSDEVTCEVEPMTIDEALAIVENPFGDSDQDEPYLSQFIDLQRRWVMVATDGPVTPHNYVDQSLIEEFQNPPDEDSFGIASERMNGFLACGQNGTVGQLFHFIRPFEIQRIVLTSLPVYRDEEAVRSALENLLPMQASELVAASDSAYASSEYVFMANPNLDDAAGIEHTYRYGMSETVMMGVTVTGQNGEIVFQNDYRGRTNPAGPLITTDRMRVIMGKSLIDEQWYVLAVILE